MDGFDRFSQVLKTGEEVSCLDPGCVRLMQEIVIRAVQDLFEEERNRANPTDNVQYVMGTARYWLFYDESIEPFSFSWICDMLGIDRSRFVAMVQSKTIKNARGQQFRYGETLVIQTSNQFPVSPSLTVFE